MDASWRSLVEFRSMVASLERRVARMEGRVARLEGILGPWGALPAKTLSDFLQLCVLIPRAETSEALQGGVLPEVERVLKVVHRLDARFGPDFQRSGSYIEGLKVSEPDEFDFLVPLKGLDEGSFSPGSSTLALREGRPDESFLAVTLGPCYDQACSTCGRGGKRGPASQCSWRHHDVADSLPSGRWLLNPQKVMGTFKQSVSEALRQEPGKVTVQRLQQGTPAVTLSVPHDQKEISVDLVPVIKNPFSEWSVPWPRPGQSWPSAEKIREIQDTGVDLVAKHNLFWRYSFSRIERVLLEKIDEDGGRRRDSLRILKKVREDHWKNKYGKVLVSYHLKTVLFWACEENPSKNDWEDLTVSFVRLVDYLVDYLQKGNLPHYFLGSDVNLFKPEHSPRLQELLDDVIKFKTSPMKYLK